MSNNLLKDNNPPTLSKTKPFLGAHMSIAGGLHKSIDRIKKVGGNALQIFTRNQRQWNAKPLSEQEITQFLEKRDQAHIKYVASHASYLVNLAATKQEILHKSINAMTDELNRCQKLGIDWIVIHPGSHGGRGSQQGLEQITQAIDKIIELAGPSNNRTILLETTAGQGSSLGAKFEELSFILNHSQNPDRLGICVDTCHIFAAGYDISTKKEYENTFKEFDKIIGIEHIKMFHLNDSKKGLGSRVDRHEHIGKGEIGLKAFECLINDSRFQHIPMVLETPKSKELIEDIENLNTLRSLFYSAF